METFNFPYHGNPEFTPSENSPSIELSGGFKFASEPSEPIIRTFRLSFPVMTYFTNPDGSVSDTIEPTRNVLTLYNFYTTHGTWKTFLYPHPVFGNIKVKFDKPFTIPAVQGNLGMVRNIKIDLREHP